jgi:hypothetical protein
MNDSSYYDAELADPRVRYAGHYENDDGAGDRAAAVAARAARAMRDGNRHMNGTARERSPGIRHAGLSERAGKPGAWTTQAVLDAIHSGQLRAELLADCEFWAAKAVQQRMQADAEIDPGSTERQIEDWNIHNDHVYGLTADHDLDREA